MIQGILLVIFASLVLVSSITYYVNYWAEAGNDIQKWEKGFYTQNFDPEKKKIFLIGSSQVHRLNATHIEDEISQTEDGYTVFNLARDDDKPEKRIDELEKIIYAKPVIVVYGVTFRDFIISDEQKTEEQFLAVTKPENKFADPEDFFKESSSYLINNFCIECNELFNLDYFKNPQKTTLDILYKVISKQEGVPETGLDLPNTPFRNYHGWMYLVNDEWFIEKTYQELVDDHAAFETYANKEINTTNLENIIIKLKKNNVKVVLFSVPLPNYYLERINDDDIEKFESVLDEISNNNDVNVYHLYDKYADLNVWNDIRHGAR